MATVGGGGDGGEEIRGSGRVEGVFERRHGELVEETGATGEARVSSFSGARVDAGCGPGEQLAGEIRRKQEEIAGMGRAEVLAFEERLWALRLRVLQRIREEEGKAAGATAKDQPSPEGVASTISSGS